MRTERFRSFIPGFIITLFISTPLFGQFNTYSPYTRFALGDLTQPGIAQNLGMGGTGLAIHENNRINYLNPAAFSALDSTSVYFDVGLNTYSNRYETENYSNTWWNMNLHLSLIHISEPTRPTT